MAVNELTSRVRYIEPTEILDGDMDNLGVNGYMSPLEDMCISLDLEAVLSDRNSCGIPDSDGTVTRIYTTSFVGKGSYMHGTDGTLTTNFTDADSLNPDGNTDECFGIKSVSISYDMGTPGQAFSPNVIIQFVDVRGISVMSKKENDENGSFYRALFMYPSPLFRLSVKGFYGCEVTYNLALSHPVKIDFDSSTGNFNITASFKGYMFGIYNDLPLAYAVVAPFMDYVGCDYWEKQVSDGNFTVKNGDVYVPMIKFPEFREKVATASMGEEAKGLEQIFNNSVSYAEKEKSEALGLTDAYPLRDWSENDKYVYQITKKFSESERNDLKINITDYVAAVDGYDSDKAGHKVKFGELFSFLRQYAGTDARLIEAFLLTRQDKGKPFVLKTDNDSVRIRYNALKDLFQEEIDSNKDDTYLYLWVISKTSDENVNQGIKRRLQEIDDLKKKADEEFQRSKNQLITKALGFPPTIENLYRMIFAHMETFMRAFYNCMGIIKGQMDGSDREKREVNHYKKSITMTDALSDNGILPPFPLFVDERTHGTDKTCETMWLGELDNGGDLEEREFAESLIAASKLYSIKSKAVDETIRRMRNPDENDGGGAQASVADDPFKNKDLKLSVYLTLKNLYDRWLCSTPESRWRLSRNDNADTSSTNGYKDSDFDNFIYIDTFYHNIGQKLIIDSSDASNLISKCLPDGGMNGISGGIEYSNHTVYEYLYEIASNCGGNLMALPVMYGIKDNEALGKLFKVLSYDKKSLGNASMTYTFLYTYKPSEQLATGLGKVDDSFMLTDKDLRPSSLSGNDGNLIPAFGVTYARQNQAIFKNISFESDKPGVTDRSLAKTMAITQTESKGPRETRLFGQDIYGVYSSMQYSCSVEMMGNAQIMPMMYFQLNNIPYWKGTYMVTNVSHEITPGNMETTFKGIRINRNAIPLTKAATITLRDTDWKVDKTNNNSGNIIENMMNSLTEYPDNPLIKITNGNDLAQSMEIRDRLMKELGWKDYMAAALIGCVYGEAGGFKPWMVNVGEKSGSLRSSRACYNKPGSSEPYNGAYSYGAGIIQFTFWNRKLRAAQIVAAKNGGLVHGMKPEEFLMAIDGPGKRTCTRPSAWQKAAKVDYKGGIENLTLDEQFDVLIGELINNYPAINKSVKMSKNLQEALAVIYCGYIGGFSNKVEIPTPTMVQKKVTAYMRANPRSKEQDHYMRRLGYAKNFC